MQPESGVKVVQRVSVYQDPVYIHEIAIHLFFLSLFFFLQFHNKCNVCVFFDESQFFCSLSYPLANVCLVV